MDIGKQVIKVLFLSITLLFVVLVFRQPHKAYFDSDGETIYARGNAPDDVRSEVIEQLEKFQGGYTARDLERVDSFMTALFSQENLLVLGTMPDEIFIGPRDVSKLIYSDWNAWGDVVFLVDTAHISSAGNVAWISTIGRVRFDIPRFLVLPLRLSAVMVKEGPDWKFQSMQFQFDLNVFTLFFVTLILFIWLAVSLATLLIKVFKRYLKTNRDVKISA
jgi:hypothetical protein